MSMRRILATALIAFLFVLGSLAPAHAQPRAPQRIPAPPLPDNDGAPPSANITGTATRADRAFAAGFESADDQPLYGVIYLDLPAPAQLRSQGVAAAALDAHQVEMAAAQQRIADAVAAQGGQVVYRFTTLSSGLAVILPPQAAARIATLPGVERISRVGIYDLHLSETVPFIGAQALHDLNVTGNGIKIAVIDSGIDYTHRAFGGPGTVAAYEAAYYGSDPACNRTVNNDLDCAYAKPAAPALFGPAAPKVKGGYDFLGEAWTPAQRIIIQDPNPIDRGGHGTHVADIIAGLGYPAGVADGNPYPAHGPGVAPGALLYAYKACAAYSSACEGLALLSAMDKAMEDGVDIINLSLGSSYGQPEDDLTHFAEQAVAAGVIVVASAGNSGDKPYIVGSPSIGAGVISVAQTEVPSSRRIPLQYTSSAGSGRTGDAVPQPWAPSLSGVVSGPLVYGNGDGTNPLGCAPFTADLSGKVVLIDRGECTFTAKARHASQAGAALVLIGLVAPGTPFIGGDGGDRPITAPVFMIDQASATLLKSLLPGETTVSVDPAEFFSMAYTMVTTSARGPRNHDGRIKPDIAAPGASVSAQVGTGSRTTAFGGTSGAAPMVAGTAALLKEKYGNRLSPAQIKALLMNNAVLEIYQSTPGGTLAAVTRAGAGQVNASAAYSATLIAWDSTEAGAPTTWSGSLSFGYVAVATDTVFTRTLTLYNLDTSPQQVTLESFHRFADDAATGVVVAPVITTVTVPPDGVVQVPVRMEIYPAGNSLRQPSLDPLHPWEIDRGDSGADGDLLTRQEVDGHIRITPQSSPPIHVVWQVLPKAAADTRVARTGDMTATLTNASPGVPGITDVFDLVDVSANIHNYTVGDCVGYGLAPGCNESPVDIKEVGVRSYRAIAPNDFLEFAVTLHDHPYRAGQYPVEIDVLIDNDNDDIADYAIYNADADYREDGRNVVFVVNLRTRTTILSYYVDATFNSQNLILPMDAASIGVTPGEPFGFAVFAAEIYYQGRYWDCSPIINCLGPDAPIFTGGPLTFHRYAPGKPRYAVAEDDQILNVPAGNSITLAWTEPAGNESASPAQRGLLFLHRNAPVGQESSVLRFDRPLYLPALHR